MTATNAATGSSALHDPPQIACATSRPVIPTYMGLRLITLLPVVTSVEACSGWNGFTVVPLRRNARLAPPARATEASETAVAAAARPVVGVRAGPVSRPWAKPAARA